MFSLILIFILLLILSAFFSSSETALFSLSGVQIRRIGDAKSGAGAKIAKALAQPRKVLVTILLGNELVNVSLSIAGAAMISRIPMSAAAQTIMAVVIITPILLVAGEIIPKNLAFRHAQRLAPVLIWPLYTFYKLLKPVRVFLTGIADRVVLLLGGKPARTGPMIMEEEYRRLVDMGRESGILATEESDLIHNVFDFSDKVVREIMTPAEKIFSLDFGLPYEKIIEGIKCVQFSRIPFYERDKDNIIGILHVKGLFAFHRNRLEGKGSELKSILHEPIFISEDTLLEDLLKEFQRTQLHMAVVRDESGKVRGVVTMDDVLKELFGAMK